MHTIKSNWPNKKERRLTEKSRETTAVEMDAQEIQILNYQTTTLKLLIEEIFLKPKVDYFKRWKTLINPG